MPDLNPEDAIKLAEMLQFRRLAGTRPRRPRCAMTSPDSRSCPSPPTARICSTPTSSNQLASGKPRPGFAGTATVTPMTGNTGIRLLGFANFEASKRFLHALDNDIWVSRWEQTAISTSRPEDLNTRDAMRAALEQPSLITVVSAHAGYFVGRLAYWGDGGRPVLPTTTWDDILRGRAAVREAPCHGVQVPVGFVPQPGFSAAVGWPDQSWPRSGGVQRL